MDGSGLLRYTYIKKITSVRRFKPGGKMIRLQAVLAVVVITALLTCSKLTAPVAASSAPRIGSLSSMQGPPLSTLTIMGTGFGTASTVSVRFSDSSGYRIDVQAIESDPTSVQVCVPPYFASGAYGPGELGVQVIETSGLDTMKSNSIGGFQIQDLPMPATPTGTVTLNLLTAELNYLDSLQIQVQGTAMETPDMDSAILVNRVNLANLASQVQSVVQTSASFSLGTINGNPLTVGPKELLQSDRLILAMFRSNPGLAKRLATNSCPDFMESDAIAGPNSSNAFRSSASCIVQSVPAAFNTSFGFLLGIGGATAATLGLGLEAFGVAVPPAGFAMVGCMLLYAGIMYAGSELAIGAELENIDKSASYQAIQIGIKQTEALFTDPIKSAVFSKIFGETAGYIKDIYDGYEQASSAIETSPISSACTFAISAPGQAFDSSGGNGTVTLTTGTGCAWTAEVDNVDWITVTRNSIDTGTGIVSFSVQANTTTEQRTGSIFIAGKEFDITQTGKNQNITQLPSGFPTDVPTGTYAISVEMNTPAGGSSSGQSFTLTNADISTLAQALESSMNTIISQCETEIQNDGCTASSSVSYAPWNGASFTMTGTIVGVCPPCGTSGICYLGGTVNIIYTVTKQ